jgi:outer membrane receptor protein involved in Fe transport
LPGTLTTEAEHRTIPEEKLYSYELGFKAKWLDGRLVTNFSAYHMDWKNQTTSVNFPLPQQSTTFGLSVSQGNSRVNGGGIEIVAVPFEGVNVRATISYNDSAYKTWCSTSLFALLGTSSPGKINCVIADGNKLENVPPWSGSLNVNYNHPLVGDWDWLVRGTFQYQDGMWESDMNLLRTEAAYVFNLNVGVENDHFNIEAYCSNCTDIATPYRIIRLVDARAGPLATTNVSFTGSPRKPREFGVKAAWKF